MRSIIYVLLLLLLTGCGSRGHESTASTNIREQLELGIATRPIEWNLIDCDGALWAGLAVRSSASIQLSAFLDNGRPMRRLGSDCLPPNSASTTSNDMITGLILGLLSQRNLPALHSMYVYGYLNKWVMGTPESLLSRVYLRPNGQSLLARAIEYTAGGRYPEANYPVVYTPLSDQDYQTHLQLISILIGRDLGRLGTNPLAEAVVQETCKHNRQDALAMIICGNGELAAELLLGDYQYPDYVRGADIYRTIHWRLAAKLVLEQ